MSKARDVADLAKAGELPADVAKGAVPVAVVRSARELAMRLASSQLDRATRDLPSDIAAECELLAAILWSASYGKCQLPTDAVADLIDAKTLFHLPAHQAIWDAAVSLSADTKSPTPVAVHSEIVQRSIERAGGGLEYLEALVRDAKPTSIPVARGYAQSIRTAWARRRLIDVARRMDAEARNTKKPIEDVGAAAIDMVGKVASETVVAHKSFVRMSTALTGMFKLINDPVTPCVMTGFKDVDEVIGGLFFTETSIVAARTSVGKTAFVSKVAVNIVELSGNKMAAYYVSLEMKAALFAARLVAARARVFASHIRKRKWLTEEDKAKIARASLDIANHHIYFVDSQIQTLASINAGATALRRSLATQDVKLALIVIDHLGLVKPSEHTLRSKRNDQVAETSRGLRFLATEHDCHVIGLAQINREAAKRKGSDAIPQLHEIKDCGGVEEDADNVLILHRERTPKGAFAKDTLADLIISKARSGETDEQKIGFDAKYVDFYEHHGAP